MAEPVLKYEVRNEIAYITLNRPHRRNALNDELSHELIKVWPKFEKDDSARVGILRGEGRDFCVGLDLNPGEVKNEIPHLMHQGYPRNGTETFKPLIAAVQGNCMGGGYAFAVRGCDFTIMADNARLGFPEARAGISIAPIDYVPLMPFKISLEFMMLAYKGGRFMDAQRAYPVRHRQRGGAGERAARRRRALGGDAEDHPAALHQGDQVRALQGDAHGVPAARDGLRPLHLAAADQRGAERSRRLDAREARAGLQEGEEEGGVELSASHPRRTDSASRDPYAVTVMRR